MDPKDFMDFLDFIRGGIGEGFGPDYKQLGDTDWMAPSDTVRGFLSDAAKTAGRVNEYVPDPVDPAINNVFEPMADTSARYLNDIERAFPSDYKRGMVGGQGIANPALRLSGEGNLGTYLTSAVLPILASRGDPMAQYLMYLSKTQGQQV